MVTKLFNLIHKFKRYGIQKSILILKDKIKKKKLKEFELIANYFNAKSGIEIGGPSDAFTAMGYLPVYTIMKSLDGVNFSNSTVWTGVIEENTGFIINGKNVGNLYIAEGTDLSKIKDNSYDFVLSCNNIEHIANPMKAVEQWILKLKTNGVLVIIAPRKESNFDHKRQIVKFSHLLEDYQNNTDEYDLTHLEEILQFHDLSLDLPEKTYEQFKARSLKNYENRCLHHHVFDLNVLKEICLFFKLNIILTTKRERDYIIIAKKV